MKTGQPSIEEPTKNDPIYRAAVVACARANVSQSLCGVWSASTMPIANNTTPAASGR